MASQENVFYRDGSVLVTNARAVLGASTFAMANITSVTAAVIPADRTLGIVISVFGGCLSGFCGLIFLASLMLSFNSSSKFTTSVISGNVLIGLFVLFGILILGVGIFLAIRAKPTYVVRIGSASGETNVLPSKDYSYISRVVNAMNQAIIYRG
jgi:hypothetical protein